MLALLGGLLVAAAFLFGPAMAQEKAIEKDKVAAPGAPNVPSSENPAASATSAGAGRYQFITAGTDYLLVDTRDGRVFRREKTGGGPVIPGQPLMPAKVTWVEEDTSAARAAPDPKK
jgi:hypothetical protein